MNMLADVRVGRGMFHWRHIVLEEEDFRRLMPAYHVTHVITLKLPFFFFSFLRYGGFENITTHCYRTNHHKLKYFRIFFSKASVEVLGDV